MTRREVMNLYLSVIRECLETGISPRCHLEDITRSDIYGFVIPFCVELMKLMDEYKIPIKIRACDTMGYGVNFPGAVIPRSVSGMDTMTFTRRSTTRLRHGFTVQAVSTALCLVSEREPEIHLWKQWYLSMHS